MAPAGGPPTEKIRPAGNRADQVSRGGDDMKDTCSNDKFPRTRRGWESLHRNRGGALLDPPAPRPLHVIARERRAIGHCKHLTPRGRYCPACVKERRKVAAEMDELVGQRRYVLAPAADFGLSVAERRAEAERLTAAGWSVGEIAAAIGLPT